MPAKKEEELVINFDKEKLDSFKFKLSTIDEFISTVLKEEEDYGIIPSTTKPTLYKGGAEKLIGFLGYTRKTRVVDCKENWDAVIPVFRKNVWDDKEKKKVDKWVDTYGFVSYVVECDILDSEGRIVGSGLGAGNSRESKYISQGAIGSQNTILKMAEKRAMVDAALTLSLVSGRFTQDVEDIDPEILKEQSEKKASYTPKADANGKLVAKEWDLSEVLKFGSGKGKTLEELDEEQLKFYAGTSSKDSKPDKDGKYGNFAARSLGMLNAIKKIAEEKGYTL